MPYLAVLLKHLKGAGRVRAGGELLGEMGGGDAADLPA